MNSTLIYKLGALHAVSATRTKLAEIEKQGSLADEVLNWLHDHTAWVPGRDALADKLLPDSKITHEPPTSETKETYERLRDEYYQRLKDQQDTAQYRKDLLEQSPTPGAGGVSPAVRAALDNERLLHGDKTMDDIDLMDALRAKAFLDQRFDAGNDKDLAHAKELYERYGDEHLIDKARTEFLPATAGNKGLVGAGILGTGAAGLGGAAYGAKKLRDRKKEASAELFYKLGAFAAANTSLVKKADLSEIMGDPEALQTLGLLGGAGVAAGGAAAYPFVAKAAPARPSSMAEGLEGGDRGRLRRIFEHLVDPSSSSAHQRGLEMRAGMGPNKAEALAEKIRGEHGMGEKFLRGLSLALAPLKLPLSPVLAPAHAIKRISDRKNFDSAMRSSMGPVAQTFYGMFDPENATTPAQAYLAKEVRRLSGGKELPMGDFREAFEKQQAKSNA